jgi:hypothetical protein
LYFREHIVAQIRSEFLLCRGGRYVPDYGENRSRSGYGEHEKPRLGDIAQILFCRTLVD